MNLPSFKINKSNITFLVSSVAIIALIYFIYPTFNEISQSKEILNDKRAELEFIHGQNSDVAWVKTEAEKVENDLAEIYKQYVQGQNALEFITELENEAAQLDLADPRINIPGTQLDDLAEQIPVQITIIGSFQKLVQYIIELEKTDYLIDIEDIKFSLSDSELGPLELEITSSTYWVYQ